MPVLRAVQRQSGAGAAAWHDGLMARGSARERREAMRQPADVRHRLDTAEEALAEAQAERNAPRPRSMRQVTEIEHALRYDFRRHHG